VVDGEQKSVRIESLITRILSNFIDINEAYSIETSSNFIDIYKSNLTKSPLSLKFQDGSSINMSSICNMTNFYCSSQHSFTFRVKSFLEKIITAKAYLINLLGPFKKYWINCCAFFDFVTRPIVTVIELYEPDSV
jgi:hypothetical protein